MKLPHFRHLATNGSGDTFDYVTVGATAAGSTRCGCRAATAAPRSSSSR